MAMKSSTTRGTPINHYGPGGGGANRNEGYNPVEKPKGFSGTVNKQFEGDQKGNRQEGIASGTPYESKHGNPDEFHRVRSHGPKGGVVLSENGMNMNDPRANGNGVIFDGVSQATGYRPGVQPQTMDSPVPEGGQRPIQNAPKVLNDLRSGEGDYFGPGDGPKDSLLEQGGVMSRGMDETAGPGSGMARENEG